MGPIVHCARRVRDAPGRRPKALPGRRLGPAGIIANHSSSDPPPMIVFTVTQAWAVLASAIVPEVAGTTCVWLSEVLTRVVPSMLIFVFCALSFALNTIIRTLGLSVVCPVWAGVGTVLTAPIGFLCFKEPATAFKLVSIGLTVIGVMGLHAASRVPA